MPSKLTMTVEIEGEAPVTEERTMTGFDDVIKGWMQSRYPQHELDENGEKTEVVKDDLPGSTSSAILGTMQGIENNLISFAKEQARAAADAAVEANLPKHDEV